jgi:hypothetical protein
MGRNRLRFLSKRRLIWSRVKSSKLNYKDSKVRAGGHALIPKNAFGCRIPAVFRVRALTLRNQRQA